jgi:methylenetetrahydrofolate dehydrogenase (NADP+)/methenyltetrahydrofolate cyclohydrolase
MPASLIEGAPIARRIETRLRDEIAKLAAAPRLVGVMATKNGGARYYARSQRKACREMGIEFDLIELPTDASTERMIDAVRELDSDPTVTGIILINPLPQGVDARTVQRALDPDKDVEGVHPRNIGRLFYGDFGLAPCTPHAVVTMLDEAGVDLAGRETVVVGHSEIVGKPTLVMLLKSRTEAPTVTCCHIATRDLAAHTRRAEVLIVAAGKAGLITGDMVREGAVVVDVGINRVKGPDGKSAIVGDVDFEAVRERASMITPVPGGVGVVTTALLLSNTVECARRQAERDV